MRDGHLCKECDTVVDPERETGIRTRMGMIAHRLCRECLRWRDVLKRILEPGNLRIDGIQYWIRHDIPDPPHVVSHTILRHDGQLITTTSLVRMGQVPGHFVSRLEDNAVFVQELEGES